MLLSNNLILSSSIFYSYLISLILHPNDGISYNSIANLNSSISWWFVMCSISKLLKFPLRLAYSIFSLSLLKITFTVILACWFMSFFCILCWVRFLRELLIFSAVLNTCLGLTWLWLLRLNALKHFLRSKFMIPYFFKK